MVQALMRPSAKSSFTKWDTFKMKMGVKNNLQEQEDHLDDMDWEKTASEHSDIVAGLHTSKIYYYDYFE